ncbi:MAG: hypothetical protein V4489_02875, partial [Chlamydiota bacterium]
EVYKRVMFGALVKPVNLNEPDEDGNTCSAALKQVYAEFINDQKASGVVVDDDIRAMQKTVRANKKNSPVSLIDQELKGVQKEWTEGEEKITKETREWFKTEMKKLIPGTIS